MNRFSRIMIALLLLLSGLALIPNSNLLAGAVSWQRFAGGYEDTVNITVARYFDSAAEGGNLEVRATTTAGSNAVLSVYRTSDNLLIGNLTWTGSDHHGTFPLAANPQVITVRSSAGGEDTATVETVPTAVELSTLNAGAGDASLLIVGGLALVAGLALFAALARRR